MIQATPRSTLFPYTTPFRSQSYGDNVTLAADVISASTGNAAVSFNGTVNGGQALTVNTTGTTTFGSTVSYSSALTHLKTNTGGTTSLSGEIINNCLAICDDI